MDMLGTRALAASPQQVWDALNDPTVLQTCIPGCDKFEPTGEGAYAVGTQLKIGPVSAKFTGKVQLSDVQPPSRYTIGFEGQGGAAGFGKGSAKVALAAASNGGTQLDYTVNAQVGGKIAQLGQRLIDGAAKVVADDFFKRFEAALLLRHPELANAINNIATNQAQMPTKSSFSFENLCALMWRDLRQPPWTYVAFGAFGAAVMVLVLWASMG